MTAFDLAVIFLAGAETMMVLVQRRMLKRMAAQEESLNTVRFAAYELIKNAQEDADDLKDALQEAGVDQPRPRYQERLRRMRLTPEERERESMERFNAVVADFERASANACTCPGPTMTDTSCPVHGDDE